MSIKEQLEQTKEGFIAAVPEEVHEEIFSHIQEQLDSGTLFGLKEGEKAPNFVLANPVGGEVNLYDELAKGPVVLTFYRGSWCPFCNIQLRAYQQILPEIISAGARLIAVSPQSPDNSLSHKEKEELTFQVLSDANGKVAESYNILFELPDGLKNIYMEKLGLDLAVFNATERWVLPVPATFIIDREGIIRRAHVDADFTKRMEPQEIIDQLKML